MSEFNLYRSTGLDNLSVQGTEVMIKRVTETLRHIPEITDENRLEWTENLLSLLRTAVGVKRGVTLIEAHTLWLFKKNWDLLDLSFRSKYEMQFDVFATRETGLSIDTIENYMRAAKLFLDEGYQPSGLVKVPERDATGAIILENGSPKMRVVDWDPTQVDMTKLVLLTPLARTGDLDDNPVLLSLAMDSNATVSQMRLKMYGGQDSESSDYEIRFRLEGPLLVVVQNGRSAPIAELYFEEANADELIRAGIERLLSVLSVPKDEQIILGMSQKRELAYFEDVNE